MSFDSAVIPKGLFGQGAQVRTALTGKVLSTHLVESRACGNFPDTLAIFSVFTPVKKIEVVFASSTLSRLELTWHVCRLISVRERVA